MKDINHQNSLSRAIHRIYNLNCVFKHEIISLPNMKGNVQSDITSEPLECNNYL